MNYMLLFDVHRCLGPIRVEICLKFSARKKKQRAVKFHPDWCCAAKELNNCMIDDKQTLVARAMTTVIGAYCLDYYLFISVSIVIA